MNSHFFILATALVITTSGCASYVDVESEQADLLKTDQEWASAVTAGNVERILFFWANDATVYFPGGPVAAGKEEIQELIARNRAQPDFSLAHHPSEATVSASGELGYTSRTSFKLSVNDAEGKPLTRRGNYLCIWKKQADGSWKCVVEISNFRLAVASN